MKKYLKYSGLLTICIGIVLDVIEYVTQPQSNLLLFCGLFLIIGGCVAHVWILKHSD